MGLSSGEADDFVYAMAGDAIVNDALAQSPASVPAPAPTPALQVIVLVSLCILSRQQHSALESSCFPTAIFPTYAL